MAESNSQPIRCPCGFFGSAQTLGLCSKCFREREESRDRTILSSSETVGRGQGNVASAFEISSPSTSSPLMPQVSMTQSTPLSLCKNEFYATNAPGNAPQSSQNSPGSSHRSVSPQSKAAVIPSSSSPNSRTSKETSSKSLPASPPELGTMADAREKSPQSTESPRVVSDSLFSRGMKRKFEEEDAGECIPVPQKNKRRCYHCNTKLDLALQAIGRCKCDFVFCSMHRLPEQHDCGFDHKETSREEARSKMVVFKKHVGTALKRLDSDS